MRRSASPVTNKEDRGVGKLIGFNFASKEESLTQGEGLAEDNGEDASHSLAASSFRILVVLAKVIPKSSIVAARKRM